MIQLFITNAISGELEKHVREMPKAVTSILENGKWNAINKIDKFIEQLENVQDKLGVNVDDVIVEIEEQVLKVARQKDSNITKLIAQFKIEDASEELHSLTLLVDLKCLAPFKAKGMQTKTKKYKILLRVRGGKGRRVTR